MANAPKGKRLAIVGVSDCATEVFQMIYDALGIVGEELEQSEVDSESHHLAAYGSKVNICVMVVTSLLEFLGPDRFPEIGGQD